MTARRVRAFMGWASLLWLSACAGHREPPPSADAQETVFRDHLRVLASDDFEGRRPGTSGEDKTIAYLVGQFRKLGLKPGNGDSYLQAVPLLEVRASGAPSLAFSVRGVRRPLQYGIDMVLRSAREIPETTLPPSGLVFVGYGIVAPEFGWDDYAGADVRGKLVLVMVGDPGVGSHDPRLFRGDAQTAYGQWRYKTAEALRHGAAGVLLIHDAVAGYPWAAVVNAFGVPQLYAVPDGRTAPADVEGWLSAGAARALFVQAGLDFDAAAAAAARIGFKARALPEVTADAALHTTARRITSSNVIAVLPGSGHKREFVLYTAHWDHLGRAAAEAGGEIYNGAADNASGVAGLLALAQSFRRTQPPPDRSIAFLAFTAAESGMLGSAYYVENPVIPLRETAAVLNLDGLRSRGPTRDVDVFGFGNSELEEYLREAALLQGREMRPDPTPEYGMYYRSDQLSFARAGVPALYAQAGLDDSARGAAWGRAQLHEYFAHRYYQSGDKYSADWDARGALEDLQLYYEVGNRVARSRRFPRWYPDSEFRASRRPSEPAVAPADSAAQ